MRREPEKSERMEPCIIRQGRELSRYSRERYFLLRLRGALGGLGYRGPGRLRLLGRSSWDSNRGGYCASLGLSSSRFDGNPDRRGYGLGPGASRDARRRRGRTSRDRTSEGAGRGFGKVFQLGQLKFEDERAVRAELGATAVLLVGEFRWNEELPF